MTHENSKRLPPVEIVEGIYFNPQDSSVLLQYKSGSITYEIPFPLHEALKMEEYFIMVRRGIGESKKHES